MKRVVIVGAGISGLSAAYFLEKRAREAGLDVAIELLDRRDRTGGVIVSERRDGFVIEGGPDAFLTQKTAAIDLCREVGLGEQILPSNDARRKTYILQGGKLKEMPDGLMFMLPTRIRPVLTSELFSLSGKLRLAVSPLLPTPRSASDVSVSEYISRRLGKQALDRLAEPLLSAVYGVDVNSLSARAVLQRFVEMEDKYGSLWKGIRAMQRAAARRKTQAAGAAQSSPSLFVSLRDGLGELTGRLADSLRSTRFAASTEVSRISTGISGGGACFQVESVESGDGPREGQTAAHAVIVAAPAHAAAAVLEAMNPPLASKLREISYHSTITVSLGFEQGDILRPLDGFGFVVPRSEGKSMVACTWVGTKFPFRCPPGRVMIRAFLGGARDPKVFHQSDEWILKTVMEELDRLIGIRSQPLFIRIHRWDRAMPQYSIGHLQRVEEISRQVAGHPGLFLAGNGYRGIGIPDCIESASQAASAAAEYLKSLKLSR